jgi:HPt (histidine-containing phosphotransfer) domain-containing protein
MMDLEANARVRAEPAAGSPARADAPSLSPADAAIDRAHLRRMTYGDRDLEREVLRLFATQAEVLLGRMHKATPSVVSAMAHTLAGSAQSIGAWPFAEAAAAVETAAAAGSDMTGLLERLSAAARDAQVAIANLLAA